LDGRSQDKDSGPVYGELLQNGGLLAPGKHCVLLCSAGCGEDKGEVRGEGPAGAGLTMKHAGLHGKDFILLLAVLVPVAPQTSVQVTPTPNKPTFFKTKLNNFIICKTLPMGQVHTIM
jgi:hypothetical protein